MAETSHHGDDDLRHLRESSADALHERYEEKIASYRDHYRKMMSDAFESILEVEIARRLGDDSLIEESKAQAISYLEEADLAREKYEDYERRLGVLQTLLDEEDGLEGAFGRYVRTEDEEAAAE